MTVGTGSAVALIKETALLKASTAVSLIKETALPVTTAVSFNFPAKYKIRKIYFKQKLPSKQTN